MGISLFHLVTFLLCLAVVGFAESYQEECKPARCRDSGPDVRFPFWLKGRQPHYCGHPHPDFELSCSHENLTLKYLNFNPVRTSTNDRVFSLRVTLQVLQIDYESQRLIVSVASLDCLPCKLPIAVNFSSSSPLMILNGPYKSFGGITLFNCSIHKNINEVYSDEWPISCLSGSDYQVLAFESDDNVFSDNLLSCTKMYGISDVPYVLYLRSSLKFDLQWLNPSCGHCEKHGKYCRSKQNGIDDETECFDIPKQHRNGPSRKLVYTVVIGTLFLVLVISIVLYLIISLKKKKEDQKKIEKFLNDYKALRPSRFSYADIKKMTNNFMEKLGEGGYGTVFKGNLSKDIPVAVKVLKNFVRKND